MPTNKQLEDLQRKQVDRFWEAMYGLADNLEVKAFSFDARHVILKIELGDNLLIEVNSCDESADEIPPLCARVTRNGLPVVMVDYEGFFIADGVEVNIENLIAAMEKKGKGQ